MKTRRQITYVGAKSPKEVPAPLRVARVVSMVIVLVGCPFLSRTILAQDSERTEEESAKSAVYGVAASVDLRGRSLSLKGIPVKLSNDSQRAQPLSTRTDAEGHFQFTQLSAGVYLLEVNLQGFKPFTKKIVLLQRELRVQNIHLELHPR
jgi:hypothetical protein